MDVNEFRGQWFGSLGGDTPGSVMLDLDDRGTVLTGTAFFGPSSADLPPTIALISFEGNCPTVNFTAPIYPLDEAQRVLMTPQQLDSSFPDVTHDEQAAFTFSIESNKLSVSFKTNFSSASGVLARFDPQEKSEYNPSKSVSWSEFKSQVDEINSPTMVWRGQSEPWALQTSFHRSGRADLRRYVDEDVPKLQAALLPHTQTFLNLTSPLLTAGFYNLAQHHGFPTPVLDWTLSPYVAAFFAFRNRPRLGSSEHTRIFAFDFSNWPGALNNLTSLTFARPHVTIMELPAIENKRALPQQGVAMVANVHNIEKFIRLKEEQTGYRFLYAIDVAADERSSVLSDLRTMGITAASMFPGLDGTCEEIRNQLFA